MNALMTVFDNEFANLWANVDRMFNYSYKNAVDALNNSGLKRIIKRPHNLITLRDKDGTINGYQIETVYTPFSKEDVNVTVKDGSLCVSCGMMKKTEDGSELSSQDNAEYVYQGVSYQNYMFSIPLDETVDLEKITAKADDGMLRISLPLKAPELKESETRTITVQ